MSRAAGGTYTLPAGNPVVTGTIISSTWGNTTLSDVATTLTDSLSRSGLGGMTAPLLGADGAVGTPAYSFTNEPSSGIYRIGASNLGVSIAGTKRIDLGAAALSTVGLNVSLGAPAAGTSLTVNGVAAGGLISVLDAANANGGYVEVRTNATGNLYFGNSSQLFAGGVNTDTCVRSAGALDLASGGGNARVRITSSGNVTVNAPTSGTTLTVSALSGGGAISLSATSGAASLLTLGWGVGLVGGQWNLYTQSTDPLAIGTVAATALTTYTNGVARTVTSSAGNVTVNAPTSGTALTVTGVAAAAALVVNGSASTPGFSIGNSGTAFTLDCSKSNVQYVTMTGNVAAGSLTISNIQDGQSINLLLTQDGTGTRALGNPTGVKWPGGTIGVLSTAIGAVDMITFTRINAVTYATILKAFA